MNRKQKAFIVLAFPFILGFLLGLLVGGGCSRRSDRRAERRAERALRDSVSAVMPADTIPDDDVDGTGSSNAKEIIYYTKAISCSQEFNDINDLHVEMGRKVGLKKVPSTRDDVNLKGLVHITENEYLVVDTLKYSVPYLTKNAAAELNTIAKAFSDSLKSKEFPKYRLIVSSLLRTEQDVDKLRSSGNPNASDNSSHCYGTTYDITYSKYAPEDESEVYMQPYELTKVLAEVLRDERNAGHILVKYEKKEHCFHITSCR